MDDSSRAVVRDMNKCIKCRRCVRTCIDMQEVGVLEAVNRSGEVEIQTFMDKPLAGVVCINCGQCINRCPTGALHATDVHNQVWDAIDDPTKHVVIQTAPSPRAAMGEIFGLEPGTTVTYQMNTALKRMGFKHVFDTNFTADLTIIEEGTELLLRLYKALVEGDTRRLSRSSQAAPRDGSSTASTSGPSSSRTSRRPRARSKCSEHSSRPTMPRRWAWTPPP